MCSCNTAGIAYLQDVQQLEAKAGAVYGKHVACLQLKSRGKESKTESCRGRVGQGQGLPLVKLKHGVPHGSKETQHGAAAAAAPAIFSLQVVPLGQNGSEKGPGLLQGPKSASELR